MNGCRADHWNVALLCAMLSAAVSSAEVPPPPHLQQPIGSRVLLATVTDTGNRPLVELEPDDFVVDESGQTREILSLHMADYPIALLLDNTDAGAQDLDPIRRAAERFISRIGERSVAVGALTDPANLIASFEDDRATVLDRVRALSAASAASLALQATAHAARAVRDTGSPFAAIVIVSAGSVSASQATDREFLTPILESGAAVYVIANRPPAHASTALSPENDDVLRVVAEETHGRYTTIYSPASYSIALDRLADRLATEMIIEYVVPGGGPLTGDVRVGVRIPGARATGLGVSK